MPTAQIFVVDTVKRKCAETHDFVSISNIVNYTISHVFRGAFELRVFRHCRELP